MYLGFAAGVGKTYQMLTDAHELVKRGVDVVIGYLEPHGRKDTIAQAQGLELIPRCRMEYRGAVFEEMNMQAILERHPEVCVVDELPHTNVPGSTHLKRWESVLELLDAGIDVMTTMNIQHLESLNDQVKDMTGVRVRETIPDWVMKQADEVVMVDLTPRALINRLERGVVYPPEKAQRALQNFFKESTLVALREIALRQTAHEVEIRQVTLARNRHRNRHPNGGQTPSTGGSDFGSPDRPDSRLRHRASLDGHAHPPRPASGGLSPGRLFCRIRPCRNRISTRLPRGQTGSRGAPPQLRAQPAHRNPGPAR